MTDQAQASSNNGKSKPTRADNVRAAIEQHIKGVPEDQLADWQQAAHDPADLIEIIIEAAVAAGLQASARQTTGGVLMGQLVIACDATIKATKGNLPSGWKAEKTPDGATEISGPVALGDAQGDEAWTYRDVTELLEACGVTKVASVEAQVGWPDNTGGQSADVLLANMETLAGKIGRGVLALTGMEPVVTVDKKDGASFTFLIDGYYNSRGAGALVELARRLVLRARRKVKASAIDHPLTAYDVLQAAGLVHDAKTGDQDAIEALEMLRAEEKTRKPEPVKKEKKAAKSKAKDKGNTVTKTATTPKDVKAKARAKAASRSSKKGQTKGKGQPASLMVSDDDE